MQLKGKVAVIAGASSGVGYAAARLFAREGAPDRSICRSRRPGKGRERLAADG